MADDRPSDSTGDDTAAKPTLFNDKASKSALFGVGRDGLVRPLAMDESGDVKPGEPITIKGAFEKIEKDDESVPSTRRYVPKPQGREPDDTSD